MVDLSRIQVKPILHKAEYSARSGKPIGFHRIPPKAYAEKSDQVQLFRRRKIPQTNHIAHFAYHVIKTIAAPYVRMIPSSGKPA